MITRDELEEAADVYNEREEEEPTIWSNPDIPRAETVAASADASEFHCPYFTCGEDYRLNPNGDYEENLQTIIDLIERNNGTFRCDNCGEPLYGFFRNGDH